MKKTYWLIIFSLIISCLLTISSCDKLDTLSTPERLEVEMTTLTLSWREVKDARLYTINVRKEGAEEPIEYIASKNYYSLSQLDEGKYTITVRANGKEDVINDSEWSEPLEFVREREPGFAFVLINGDTEYELASKGTATGDIVIPDTYRGLPVTSIADRAFFNKSDVTSVTFGKNIKNIGQFAFANCSYLEELVLPEGLVTLGNSAFASCRLLSGSVVIPHGVKVIPKNLFAYCGNIESVTLGKSVETIENNAFTDCSSLVTLFIPESVRTIGEHAFAICSGLTAISFANGITEIGAYAFSGLPELVSVDLPDSLITLGEGAFYECPKLSDVSLGEGLENVALGVFNSTALWESSPTNEVYAADWFLGCKDNTVTAVSIREGTVGIASYALYGYPNVVGITLPNSVETVGEAAFAKSSLINAVLGSGVKVLGANAFAGCKSLVDVVLGTYDFALGGIGESSLEVIESYAFTGCEVLDEIEMPSSLKTVGSQVFRDSGLYKSAEGVVYAGNWVVDYNDSIEDSIILREGTVGIANYAFYGAKSLAGVKMPASVKVIGRSAFYECTALVRVELPLTLEVINDYTFYRCTSLKLTSLPPMLKYIGRSAFYKCSSTNLAMEGDTDSDTLIIPDGVTYIGDYAFYCTGYREKAGISDEQEYNNYGIDRIIFPAGLEYIGDSAFYGSLSLVEIDLGGTVELGPRAFYKCDNLARVAFGSALTTIGERAFYRCESITEIDLPSSVRQIGNYAFYKCSALSRAELGGVESIGSFAFFGDYELASLVLPTSLTSIGRQAFRNCDSLTSVIIPSSLVNISEHAFYGCDELTLYVAHAEVPEGFAKRWNSSYRPVVYGCTVSEEGDYVIYYEAESGRVANLNSTNSLSDPVRDGYTFAGWGSSSTATKPSYTSENVADAEGGRRLYAIWIEEELN